MLLPGAQYPGNLVRTVNKPKLKLLYHGDDAQARTGFGTVARHILTALHNTGLYDIHHLAINHHGDFVDTKEIPWQRTPAKLLNPADPHGNEMFIQALIKGDYDVVLVNNDVYVTQIVAKTVGQVLRDKMNAKKKVPKFIYYYPVDCHVLSNAGDFVRLVDVPVCYTDHGREETLLTCPEVKDRLIQIPHGVNTDVFRPLPLEVRKQIKKQMLGADPDTFVVINVNRNSSRKQIQYSMLAFREFHKLVPNSKMYIHTAIQDQGGDLILAINDLGLDPKKDIIFPVGYSPANGVPDDTLNGFYNMADMFLTTHLGEGFGLTVGEAMAAGIPIIVPDNTAMPQLAGTSEERGYMYPCRDLITIDNSGYRKKGYIEDIVVKMMQCYTNKEETQKKVVAAREWTLKHQWKDIGQKWVELVAKTIASRPTAQQTKIGTMV